MASDWIQVVRAIEGYYSLAKGTVQGNTAGDETLRRQLVPYGNKSMLEILLSRRWGYSYNRTTVAVTSASNEMPNLVVPLTQQAGTGTFLTLRRLWINDDSGFPQEIRPGNSRTLDPLYGSASSPRARPQFFFIIGDGSVRLYPNPDANYTVWVEGEMNLAPIVETVGTTAAPLDATIAVPSSEFLTGKPNSVPTASSFGGLSLAGAGYQQYGSGNADWIGTDWSAIAGNIVTAATQIPQIAVTAYPLYLRSQNWLITWFPKLLEFAVLREVATYFKSQEGYKLWESRFQHEMELAVDFDNERLTALERMGVAMSGQRTNQLRSLDQAPGYDVRGGIL